MNYKDEEHRRYLEQKNINSCKKGKKFVKWKQAAEIAITKFADVAKNDWDWENNLKRKRQSKRICIFTIFQRYYKEKTIGEGLSE